jgi:hypothetical protein
MNIKERLDILKKLAQVQPATPSTSTTTPPPTITINIRTLPKFNTNLFSVRPDIIGNLNAVANKLNQYIMILSNNKVNFNEVWTNPSITGSEYANSLKNLLNLAKWLYGIITVNRPAYSLQDLRKIFNDLMNTVKSYSFPETNAAKAQSELVVLAITALSKLK